MNVMITIMNALPKCTLLQHEEDVIDNFKTR